jgi:DNA-directed RNA polymerase specialized sigma24 family protein
MPRRMRQVFTLRAAESLACAEVASRLGVSASTVYNLYAGGIRRRARFFEERGARRASQPHVTACPLRGN